MSKKELICRFCLKLPDSEAVAVDEVTRQMFDVLQMQLDFDVLENPVMCKDCSETIERLYSFKSLCADTQDLVFLSNVHENKTDIDLRSIYKAKTDLTLDQDADVCRLCMKPSRKDRLISIEALNIDDRFMEMWTKYMTEVNLNITRNPKVCFQCKDNIQCYFKFVLDIGSCNGLPQMCTVKIEDTTESSRNSCDKIPEIKMDPSVKEEKTLSENSRAHSKERIIQNCAIKQEASDTGGDHTPKLENELYIKEEHCDYDENFDGLLSNGRHVTLTQSKEEVDQSCTCGNCTRCSVRYHVMSSSSTEVLVGNAPDETFSLEQINPSGSITEKKHKCVSCSYQTNKTSDIKRHLVTHKDKSEPVAYQCSICPFQTRWKNVLNRHIRDRHTGETLKCLQCSYATTSEKWFKRHLDVHNSSNDIKMHECPVCDYKVISKNSLKRHMLRHADKSEPQLYKCIYECTFCDYKTKLKNGLARHLVIHKELLDVKLHECSLCEYKTKFKSSLKIHTTLHHVDKSELQIYKCFHCEYETFRKAYLKQHVLIHRNRDTVPKYSCKFCPYLTDNMPTFRRHSLVHKSPTEIKMYQCTICGFESKLKHGLTRHSLVHKSATETQMYYCTLCTFGTKHKYSLKLHLLTHKDGGSPERHKISLEAETFKCPLCDYQTGTNESLLSHILVHNKNSEPRVFKCFHCTFETKRKHILSSHISVKHRGEVEVPRSMYSCMICSYTSKYKASLKHHAKSHESQPDLYECEVCQFKAICKRSILKHMQSH